MKLKYLIPYFLISIPFFMGFSFNGEITALNITFAVAYSIIIPAAVIITSGFEM